MGRIRLGENAKDPATGKDLPPGVTHRGPLQYRCRKMLDGVRVTGTFETARLAREWLEETSAEVRKGEFVDRRPLAKITLGQLTARFRDEVMVDGGERKGAKNDRAHIPSIINDVIAELPLAKLSPADVRRFRDRQADLGFARATVTKRMNMIAAILKHAISEWDYPLKENVATGKHVSRLKNSDVRRTRRLRVPSPAAQRLAASRGEDVLVTEEEVLYKTLSAAENKWLLPMARFAISQATRLGEQLGLRWRDVNFEQRTITLHGRLGAGVKNEEHRRSSEPEVRGLMPRSIEILKEIEPAEGGRPDDLVFPVGDYDAFKVNVGRIVRKAAERLSSPTMRELKYLHDLRYHDLRHEATSRLAKIYRQDRDLMRVTGHIDKDSMLRYYQPDPTELAMVAEEYEMARKSGIKVDFSDAVPLATE